MSLPPFQHLLDLHQSEVYRFLVATVGAQEADDCFQETFMSALRAYPGLKRNENLRGWLFTIASRKAVDHHRAAGRRARPADDTVLGAVAAPAPGVDAADGMALWTMVRRLPPKQLHAVAHRYLNDLDYREIAEITGGTEEAARRNVHEGVKKLREAYRND